MCKFTRSPLDGTFKSCSQSQAIFLSLEVIISSHMHEPKKNPAKPSSFHAMMAYTLSSNPSYTTDNLFVSNGSTHTTFMTSTACGTFSLVPGPFHGKSSLGTRLLGPYDMYS